MGFPSKPILRRGVNPFPPKIQEVVTPGPPIGLKVLAKKAEVFKASPAWPLRPLLASLGLPGQAFGGLSWPPLADFGLTWRRLACLGLPWPHLAWLRALPCPAVGVPNLRSYRPWRCFLRVRLLHSKRENGADKGLQGRLWPGFWHPWPPFGWLLEGNLAAKTASKF